MPRPLHAAHEGHSVEPFDVAQVSIARAEGCEQENCAHLQTSEGVEGWPGIEMDSHPQPDEIAAQGQASGGQQPLSQRLKLPNRRMSARNLDILPPSAGGKRSGW